MVRQYSCRQVNCSFYLKTTSRICFFVLITTNHVSPRSDISSFLIHFFLGSVPISSQTWSFATNLVASHAVLAPSSPVSRSSSITTHGQIPLTHALLASPEISCLDADIVVPFLTRELSWRIQRFDGSIVDVGDVPSLKLYVAGQQVRQCTGADEFPVYGPPVAYRSVTKGKPGSLGEEDPL